MKMGLEKIGTVRGSLGSYVCYVVFEERRDAIRVEGEADVYE